MSLRRFDGKALLRAIVAASCGVALLFALVLSASPHLHERLHPASDAPNHECAITMLTSGSYQHSPNVQVLVAPPAPRATFVQIVAGFQLVSAHLEFCLLEHAPPAIS